MFKSAYDWVMNKVYNYDNLVDKVKENNLEACRTILHQIPVHQLNAAIGSIDTKGNNTLHLAIKNNSLSMFELLINYLIKGASDGEEVVYLNGKPFIYNKKLTPIYACNKDGLPPLLLATILNKSNTYQICQTIIEPLTQWFQNYVITQQGPNGLNAAMSAVESNQAKTLL